MQGKNLYISARNWGCAAHQKTGLLLFVQRIREILLHTTSIPCKPKSASTLVIAREIFGVLDQHSKTPHSSAEANIKILIDEFGEALRNDTIAKKLIGDRSDEISQSLLKFSDSAAQLETSRYLLGRLPKENYMRNTTERIVEIIEAGGAEKRELISLCEGFISCVRHAGYPVQTIYHLLNVCFLDHEKQQMTARKRLEIFFSKFDFALHKHDVFFIIEDLAANVSATFTSVEAKFFEKGSAEFDDLVCALPLRTKNFFASDTAAGILKFSDVAALDPQSARTLAERRLRLLDDLLRFSVHGGRFTIRNQALIWREKFGYVHSNRPRAPILLVPHDADREHGDLGRLALALGSLRANQAQRFVRAIELHGTALTAIEDESQLLNVWIALETLFVSGRGAKISEVIDSVTPYVLSAWNQYIFGELWDRIIHIHQARWSDAISLNPTLQEAVGMNQLVLALAIDKFEPEMTIFLSGLDDDPLLRFKLTEVINWAQTPKGIRKYRESLRKKISFDMNRIYRTRNKIVHVGSTTRGASEVVQLAHFYLDLTLTLLSILFSAENRVGSVEQAGLEALIVDKNLTKFLDDEVKKNSKLTEENYNSLLFGRALLD